MTAPMMLDGPMTEEWLATYARKVLALGLFPGDIVVLHNLSAHKGVAARAAVQAVGAHLLPTVPT